VSLKFKTHPIQIRTEFEYGRKRNSVDTLLKNLFVIALVIIFFIFKKLFIIYFLKNNFYSRVLGQ